MNKSKISLLLLAIIIGVSICQEDSSQEISDEKNVIVFDDDYAEVLKKMAEMYAEQKEEGEGVTQQINDMLENNTQDVNATIENLLAMLNAKQTIHESLIDNVQDFQYAGGQFAFANAQ